MPKTLQAYALLMALVALAPGFAAAQPVPPPTAPAAPSGPQGNAVDSSYLLGPGDVVDIGLIGRADFGSRARISTTGSIQLPLVGTIAAADRTVLQLADDLRLALIKGGFYSDPVVRVEVVGINSRYVTVLGAVGSPGLLPLDRSYRLSEILAKVNGKAGNGVDYILLTRASGGPPEKFTINQLASGTADQDPLVKSGDKIFIPSADNEVFYISGQVKNSGAFPVSEGMTVRMAIAKGGGLAENGSEKKVEMVRGGKVQKRVKLDDPVKVGDILKVGERLF